MGLLKSYSEREVKKLRNTVKQINDLEEEMSKLSDSELVGKTAEFKKN